MIKFNYLNKNKLKKLGSVVLVTTMLGASALTLSGCNESSINSSTSNGEMSPKEVKTNTQEDKKYYAVVVEDDYAIIYDDINIHNSTGDRWTKVLVDNTFEINLPKNTHILEICTLNDAKEYVKGLVSENGTVKTYDIEKPKTFVKVK